MFGQKKSGLASTLGSFGITPNSIKKAAAGFGITPDAAKKAATGYAGQLATSAKAGLNARIARTTTGLQTKIAGAPPTPTPTSIQIPTNIKPPSGGI
jgi:hypothetical protein